MVNNKTNLSNTIDLVTNENIIVIEEITIIYDRLCEIPEDNCANYANVELHDVPLKWITIMLRKEMRQRLNKLKDVIAERYFIIDRILPCSISEKCCKYVNTEIVSPPNFAALDLCSIFTSFVFCLFFLAICIGVLFIEILIFKYCSSEMRTRSTRQSSYSAYISEDALNRLATDRQQHIVYAFQRLNDLLSNVE
jgi:hypothetical protein